MTIRNRTNITAEPGKQEIFITREFDAPREIVFKAFTDPKLLVQWLGPRRLTMTVETFEAKNGGYWRFIHKDRDGNAYGFHGVHHEIAAPRELSAPLSSRGFRKKDMLVSKQRALKRYLEAGPS